MNRKQHTTISFERARSLILRHGRRTRPCQIAVTDACGLVLAHDAKAPHPYPLFDQSAVDGYGVSKAASRKTRLLVSGEIRAGHPLPWRPGPDRAVRLFTGSAVPAGVDAVIMQEHVMAVDDHIVVEAAHVSRGMNIRPKGGQVRRGHVALAAGTVLTPAAIGFLASLGIDRVTVYRKPDVAVLVTGDEVTHRGRRKSGQVFDANGSMLRHAVRPWCGHVHMRHLSDNEGELERAVAWAREDHDVILVSGGVSVGRYDLTRPVLEGMGFTVRFHRVLQKPGKPLLFATRREASAFGLPGNPLSAWVCVHGYVLPHLRAAMGFGDPFLPEIQLPLGESIEVTDPEKTKFLPACIRKSKVIPAPNQPSHMLGAAATSTALALIPAGRLRFRKGEMVRTLLLPTI